MDTRELVERCKRREGQAMGLLYSAYAAKLERVCRKYIKDEADVQDIVHDSFVIIFTSIDRLKDPSKLESWMCTIARNLSLKHLQQPIATGVEDVAITDGETDAAPDYSRLMSIVEQLPQGYKNVLKLSVLEGLSHKEIGEMLGIAPHSSSSQLSRAKVLVLRNVRRYGVLLLALIAVLVPFLLPDNSGEPPAEVAGQTPVPSAVAEVKTDSLPADSSSLPALAPLRRLVAKSTDTLAVQRTENELVADALERDTATSRPATPSAAGDSIVEPPTVPDRRPVELIAHDYEPTLRTGDTWTLAVSFAGGSGNNLLASASFPGSIGSGVDDPNSNDGPFEQSPDTIVSTRTRHYMPLTFGLTFGTRLSSRWIIEAGLRYTLLRTDVATTTSLSDNSLPPTRVTTTQSQHYIGLPIRLTYSLFRTSSFALYASGGTTLDLPLDLSGAALWSVNFGAGIQYRLTPAVSLYAEPGCNCFLNSGRGANAVRTDSPFEFTLPVGLRFTW